ncbi:MAG TPA: DNA translocase FtsK [Polyangiaceae bacterium]|nr:DNA translocase FtsK [Polyangiaceae bacterium]
MGVRLFSPRAGSVDRATARRSGFRAGREAAALLLVAAAVYIGLALATLELEMGDGNWVGPVGAWLAEVLAGGFGVVAWLVPLELVLIATPLLRSQELQPLGLRLSGDLALGIIASSLVHVAMPEATFERVLPVGGNIGVFFGEIMRALFSTLGSFLVGATLSVLLLIARSAFSFIEWCERVAEFGRRLQNGVLALFARLRHGSGDAKTRGSGELATAGVPALLGPPEDGYASWQPREKTGIPPLAVSAALRHELGLDVRAMLEAEDAEPDADGGIEPSPAPASIQPKKSRARSKPALELLEQSMVGPSPLASKAGEASKSGAVAFKAAVAEAAEASSGDASPVLPAVASKSNGPKIVDTRPHSKQLRTDGQEPVAAPGEYVPPSPDLLQPTPVEVSPVDRERVLELARRLETTLADYGVTGKVEEIHPGPTVTTYEVLPTAGTKVSKVAAMSDDLALGLSRKVRIIAPIPGKGRIGFEIPNDARVPVNLRELIEDQRFEKLSERAPLPVVMGRDIVGGPFYADLSAMPHVIVAGATGAGKSVGVNVMLCSLLFRRSPEDLRLLMIDPKVVELAPFDGIPHMLLPVVTDMKQAAKALKWAVDEMERRYQAFAAAGTKNIVTYNRWVERILSGELPPPDPAEMDLLTGMGMAGNPISAEGEAAVRNLPARLPYIVIVVDEFADLMMQQGKEVEAAVARLAQKARAAGMHVVLATQRPSVDVITGMIKANFPTRVAFRVAQKVDSRTILDEQGAELLLGKGDMLAKMNGSNETLRVQCPFISEEEVSAITDHLRKQGTPVYHDDILRADDDDEDASPDDEPLDPRFDEAVRIVAETQRCSTSWLQRKLGIGYNRAAKIVEMMEHQGMVGPPNGSKEREICIQPH